MTPAEIVTAVIGAITDLGIMPFLAGGALVAVVSIGLARLASATR